MSDTSFTFSLPAFIQDFPSGSPDDAAMKWRWNINVSGWIQQAMPSAPSFFYDPATTPIPQGTLTAPVQWNAFPGRLDQYYSANPPNQPANPNPLTQDQIYQLADTGYYKDLQVIVGEPIVKSFPQIPQVICPIVNWNQGTKVFGPYGPRGWLDEYCEWSAARDTNGNLVRVDFACENPEYWNTLWKVSPEKTRSLYESVLNFDAPAARQISVALSDLQLFYNGDAVKDPETGQPVYNPLNKWNSGPVAIRTGVPSGFIGGVMHLTSTPNTLQTELGLAGAATIQYNPPSGSGNTDPQALICCGDYGQEYRHSDPHIGQSVNQVVGGIRTGTNQSPPYYRACLANPVGLYIQPLNNPNLFTFGSRIDPSKLPTNAQASDIWQVVRGSVTVIDPVTGAPFPGAMILHAICQIPSAWLTAYPDMTLADISISNKPITYAGQIANQFNIGLYARPLTTVEVPPLAPCAGTGSTPGQPLQTMMFTPVWNAFNKTIETAPTGATMPLASNSTFIAPQLPPGGPVAFMSMTCNSFSTGLAQKPLVQVLLPDGSGPDPQITVTVQGLDYCWYAIPGNSFPPTSLTAYTTLSLTVTIGAGAASGLRGVTVTDPQAGPSSLPAALYVLGV